MPIICGVWSRDEYNDSKAPRIVNGFYGLWQSSITRVMDFSLSVSSELCLHQAWNIDLSDGNFKKLSQPPSPINIKCSVFHPTSIFWADPLKALLIVSDNA